MQRYGTYSMLVMGHLGSASSNSLPNQGQSYIAAYGAGDGKLLWRTERDETSTWATPFIWENELRTEIVTSGKKKNRSYDLSGKLLWEFNGKMSNLVIPSPFAAHGLLYIASGYIGDSHRPIYAIKPGASGDITPAGEPGESKFIEWYQAKAASYNPSPMVYGDYYYTLLDRGFVTCHDARTGAEVYGKTRIFAGASLPGPACRGQLHRLAVGLQRHAVLPERRW